MSVTRARGVLVGLLVALLCLAAYAVPSTRGALLGRVTNTTDTAASGIYATCETAATGIGTAFFVHPFEEAAGTVAADVSGNNRPGTYRPTRGTAQTGQSVCPDDGGRAVQLNGTSQFVGNNTLHQNPQTFSVQLWFRTADNYARGGRLIGFGNATGTAVSTNFDRHVYMTNAGRLVFGVYSGNPAAIQEIITPTTLDLNNGAWHHVVATLGPAGSANPGMRLYVDGALVQSNNVTAAQVYDGYWRVGWDNLDGWGSVPTSRFFAGRVAFAAVFTTALTPVQVSTLYEAGRP